MPNAEYRNCVRHLYTNFKKNPLNKGKELKDCFWKAARSTYLEEFVDVMNEMKALSIAAHQWFQEKDPSQWSKSHFSTFVKCDMLLNNLFESFNKFILDARDKPILTLMEIIRTKLMQKVALKSKMAEKFVGPLCPKIQKKIRA